MSTPRRLERCLNIEDVRAVARRRLPRAVFDAIDGGSGDEVTMRGNREAFERFVLRPRALADISGLDTSTTVLGQEVSMPLMLAPTGMARMADSGAEIAVANAAQAAQTIFSVSSAASQSLEDIAAATSGPLWYQIYLPPDRSVGEEMVRRVDAAGYPVLCVTIDSAVLPKRERDHRNRFTVPLALTPRLVLTGVSKPRWTKDFLLGKVGRARPGKGSGMYAARAAYKNIADVVVRSKLVTWEDLRWIRERWSGKLVVKGVMRAEECAAMIDLGIDAIVVSNHGGRQLDGLPPAILALPEVVNAAGGRVEVFVDGGIRRGTDVVKAIALGARGCFVGRPYMWGLAAGGQDGVDHVLSFYRSEIERAMSLLGCASVDKIDASNLSPLHRLGEPGASEAWAHG